MASCISSMSAAVSHQGSWIRCQTAAITASNSAYTTIREIQRRNPAANKTARGTLRQSSHRQGSCTYCNFGNHCQRGRVKLHMMRLHATPHRHRLHHWARCSDRQRRERKIVPARTTTSEVPTSETIRLNLLWSTSEIVLNRKLSCGRTPGANTWAISTHFCS